MQTKRIRKQGGKILMSDKTDFLTKAIKKERHYKMIKESIQEDTPPTNKLIYVPNVTLKYTNTNKGKN